MIKKKSSSPKTNSKRTLRKINDSERLLDNIISGMQEKKAKEITSIDLRNVKNAVADFFVICHADSSTHIDAIVKSIEEFVYKKQGEEPLHVEGRGNSEWILMDYFNVVAHVFKQEKREFFGIERLWADAEIKQIASNY
ncbi:MAG: ribosome silencing factor [Bacteroidetes bacterium]|nr:MAG: ribosome silencing factor [Bacteroidota bacterium]REK00350.1 MAG: ribosome silencing factor [Bacteroidota bacterium]REK35469.1 MAG: ribosome silencing factor [Bacteroidota bacterium]REK46847.1 MAG: ribosome silencing factor [Bacteroidota bacterium]